MLVDAEWSARKKQPPDPAYPQRWLRGPLPPVSKILSTTRNEGWTGSRSCAWPPVPTSRKRTESSFWERLEPERPIWPAPWHGRQPQFYPSGISASGSAGGDLCGPANGTYRDYMKKLRKEKLLILTSGCSTPPQGGRGPGCTLELVEARKQGGLHHLLFPV